MNSEPASVSESRKKVRVLIIEDHLMIRDVVRKVCVREANFSVVGETDSGTLALDMIDRLRPDLVILDLALPDMDGFNIVERVQRSVPAARVLVLSAHCDDYTLFRIEKSGVHGFLDKNSNTVEVLREALRTVVDGRMYFSKAYHTARMARRMDPRSFAKVLTEWERAILSLIGHGLSDTEVGERLNLSPRTIQTHRSKIMRKLNLRGTPKLIAFAVENGFTQVSTRHGRTPVCA